MEGLRRWRMPAYDLAAYASADGPAEQAGCGCPVPPKATPDIGGLTELKGSKAAIRERWPSQECGLIAVPRPAGSAPSFRAPCVSVHSGCPRFRANPPGRLSQEQPPAQTSNRSASAGCAYA